MKNDELEQSYINPIFKEFISACYQLNRSVISLKKGNLMISPKTTTSKKLNEIVNYVQDSIDNDIFSGNETFHLKNESISEEDLNIYTSILYKFQIIKNI